MTDLVDAHLLALGHLEKGGENLVCNVGYGRGFSVKQVADMVKQISGADFPVRHSPPRLGDAIEVVADARLIREKLNWQPRFDDLGEIVRHALAWEQFLSASYRFKNRV